MSNSVLCLDSLPDQATFYQKYWNKKPFVVRKAVAVEGLIEADQLAGLSLEEDIRSRIVIKGDGHTDWKCEHGPFEEDRFANLTEEGWSLLVQSVELHHPPTKDILKPFGFSPCWLIDDVMVSYSVPGGGVGPHLDSYHVFLIQGKGKRSWKVGRDPIYNEEYIQDIDLKILKDDFEGDTFDVEEGDLIYIPPLYPHSGETLEESLTFSIGFLGPSLSELLVEYGHYIEEQEKINSRYDGNLLDATSAGDDMSIGELANFRGSLTDAINSDHFETWLKSYFANSDDF
ncbi:MAG: hypothetical protein HOH19_02980 [Kordiimonadaceae bacterium]|jgi:50S ribosomal protein L16 3-hydroxylase|nr:hypothetical protein [Kordiimonadaceae bacterium]MBT6031513.1 hypothetical protein [Kordiimonadaceae bacterium]